MPPIQASRRSLARAAFSLGLALLFVTPMALSSSNASAEDAAVIETRVNLALEKLYKDVPGSRELAGKAHGILVMPDIVKGGFIVGAKYGEGALRLNTGDGKGTTAQYYSVGGASVGFQAGVEESSHALFFLSRDALEKFRRSDGWEAGVDAEVTILDIGTKLGADSTITQKPIVAFVFAQGGLLAGASVEGAKYSKINR
ncbi:MAG: YSC84-related protein [Pseudomonadota bacterium]